MDLIKLSRISMKHLITLHIMLDTLSVTATAERLCLSPSSVSKTLNQLRDNLNDDLFYRHGNKLIATPLRFSIAMRESTFDLLAAQLSQNIIAQAPHIRLDIWSKDSIGFDGLRKGILDFVILPHDRSQPPLNSQSHLVWETLMTDEMICLMNPNHPLAQQEMTIALCQYSNLLFTCSRRWAETAIIAKDLVVKPLPFNYGEVAYSLVWHEPSMNDPAHRWMYEQIVKCAD